VPPAKFLLFCQKIVEKGPMFLKISFIPTVPVRDKLRIALSGIENRKNLRICDWWITIKISDLHFCGLALLKNLQICDWGLSPEYVDFAICRH
jgi:hypothetical protein